MWKLQRWGLLATLVAVAMLLVIDGAQSKRHAQQPQQSAKSQPQLQQPQQAPASDQHGTEQSPLSVKVIPAPKSEEEAARERQEREEKAELDRKLVKFNGDLAHYTLVLAIVAMLQFLALFVQAVFLRLAFKATKKSADIAEASLVTLERASVFMPDINTNWHPDTSRPGKFWWHFRPIWQNSGSTQTKDMITNVACDFRDTPLPQDFDCPPNAESYPAIIPPKGFVYGTTFTLTDDELIEVQKGTKFFYIWGTATYLDVFDGTPIHATKFCRQIINVLGDLTRPDKEVTEMFFSIVFPEHNSAD